MTKRILAAVLALLFALLLFLGTSPSRAIRAAALLNGCSWDEVMQAEFEKTDDLSLCKSVYRADCVLPDRLTGSGHATWYVYRIGFLHIPEWAGNG